MQPLDICYGKLGTCYLSLGSKGFPNDKEEHNYSG